MPPVIKTVPSGSRGAGSSAPTGGVAARASRGASNLPSRTASCGSSKTVNTLQSGSSPLPSVSTSRNRPGCSDCALRTRPHTGATGRSGASPPTAIPPRVTTTSRVPDSDSLASHRCNNSSVSCATACAAAMSAPTCAETPIVTTTTSGTAAPSAERPLPKRRVPRTAPRRPASPRTATRAGIASVRGAAVISVQSTVKSESLRGLAGPRQLRVVDRAEGEFLHAADGQAVFVGRRRSAARSRRPGRSGPAPGPPRPARAGRRTRRTAAPLKT